MDSQSLQYKAPKQPVKSKPILMHSEKASLFKYDRNTKSYATKGSVVASVHYQPDNAVYQFVVAFSQQNIATTIDISSNFSFKVQASSYTNYSDIDGSAYSLYFNGDQTAAETFAKYIAIAKCAADKYQNVVTQTLVDGKGTPIVTGDSLAVVYTGWLIKTGKVDVVFDTNKGKSVFKLKIGEGKVIKGWESGCVGMLRGETRAIVIPPQFGYGQKGSGPIPPNSVLLFEVQLKKVKRSKEEGGGEIPEPILLSEPTPSPTNNKSNIVERMKKLGANTLNVPQPTIEEEEDDFFEEDIPQSIPHQSVSLYVPPPEDNEESRRLKEQVEKMREQMELMKREQEKIEEEKKRKQEEELKKQRDLFEKQKEELEQQKLKQELENQKELLKQQLQMTQMQPTIISQPSQSGVNHVQQYIEQSSFQKNIMNIVDQVLKKVVNIEERVDKSFIGTSSEGTSTLTGPVLLKTIKKIVDDNETMRKDLIDKTEKGEILRERLNSIHEKNEQLIDENNSLLERKNDSMKEQAELIRKKMRSLMNEKEEIENEHNALQEKMGIAKKKYIELSKSYERLKDELSLLREEKEKNRIIIENAHSTKITYESKIENLSNDLKSEREAKKEALKLVQSLRDDLQEEKSEVERLKDSIKERKEKYEEMVQRMQSIHEDEKNTFKREVETLERTLKEERQSSGTLSEEQIQRYEEREKDLLLQFSQQKNNAIELALKELNQKFDLERKEIQNEFFQKGKSEGKNALQFSVESANNSSQIQINLLEQKLKEAKVEIEKLKKSSSNGSSSSGGISQEDLKKITKKINNKNKEEAVSTIKAIMNGVFQKARSQFSEESYNSPQIHKSLLEVIKQSTLEAIEKINGDESEESENEENQESSEEEVQEKIESQKEEEWDEDPKENKEEQENNNEPPPPEEEEDDIIAEEPTISRSGKVEEEDVESSIPEETPQQEETKQEEEPKQEEPKQEEETQFVEETKQVEEEPQQETNVEEENNVKVEEEETKVVQEEEPKQEEETKQPEVVKNNSTTSSFEDPFGITSDPLSTSSSTSSNNNVEDELFGFTSTPTTTKETPKETVSETPKTSTPVVNKVIQNPLFEDDEFFSFSSPTEKKVVEKPKTVVVTNNKPLFEDDDFFNFN
eukprot:TRINITY_DN1595_c0_g3_i1.p1 TRINITY_DN1595_c0_g3~~TRINITY_DN1595_c0_g3_i1.p1  ORF type:complete len:1139 (+),score=537.70 TRINITY_DN1595_c0_g3_i1:18-3434(+)